MNKNNTASPKKSLMENAGFRSALASLISILGGFLVGLLILVILAIFNSEITVGDAVAGFFKVLAGPFSAGNTNDVLFQTGNMLFNSTPLLFTGLSVAIAFKTGLFNIGAPGQYLMGAMGTLVVALSIPTSVVPPVIVWIIALLTGVLCGALWGAIPGFFKGVLGVNEVIVCIMTNWIAANIVSWVFKGSDFINVPETKMNFIKKTSFNNVSTATFGLDKLFSGTSEFSRSYMDISLIIGIIVAVVIFIILNKTTFGFELKACGYNKNASKYAGMNEKKNIILSMAIAGALAAAGASLWCLNGNQDFKWEVYQALPNDGFNGIPVALLANSNPIGVIFSSVFLRYINVGGSNLAAQSSFNEYVSQLIIAIIIYFAGFSRYIQDVLLKSFSAKQKVKANVNAEPDETETVNAEPKNGSADVVADATITDKKEEE